MVCKTIDCYFISNTSCYIPWGLKTISDSELLLNYPFKSKINVIWTHKIIIFPSNLHWPIFTAQTQSLDNPSILITSFPSAVQVLSRRTEETLVSEARRAYDIDDQTDIRKTGSLFSPMNWYAGVKVSMFWMACICPYFMSYQRKKILAGSI